MTAIKPTVTDEMVDLNPDLIELHAEAICNATGGPQWDALQDTRQVGVMRAEARAALAVVAPLIAAQALRDAANELRLLDDGRTGGYYEAGRHIIRRLEARADQIEAVR